MCVHVCNRRHNLIIWRTEGNAFISHRKVLFKIQNMNKNCETQEATEVLPKEERNRLVAYVWPFCQTKAKWLEQCMTTSDC